MTQSQKEFENKFPMPADCVRCGNGYAATSYNAWDAHEYTALWKGWQASRAALVVELPDAIGRSVTAHDIIFEVESALDAVGVKYK